MSLNSEKIFSGVEHADARSLLYATGHLQENIGRKPLIGVVNTFNEIVPGHFHLRGIADAAKQGVLMAGGVPVEFPAIAICDGITMAHKGMMYPLPSRELIADSIESMTMAHGLDGLVLVVSCDKTVPGAIMAAARMNIPSVVISGGPMPVHGVRALLSELIYNLLDNAIRYNRDNGSVSVRTAERTLSVRDTGIGIPKHHISRIFERFYRVDKSRSKATGGTGLGLAIVKHICEEHHATVTLESAEGIGTEITVTFPPEKP